MSHARACTRVRRAIFITALISAGACGYPQTDITATNTERTGGYEVVRAVAGESLTADVCIEQPSHADAVAERLLQQVINKGFRTITLNLYAGDRAVGRIEWTPRETKRYDQPTATTTVNCRERGDKGSHG